MRIKSIDFLRGVAIILVLFRHVDYAPLAHLVGWSGVDLFFVISGFLVSGLLFSEYKRTQTVRPSLFLIRRAFKIYPLFWAIIAYIVVLHFFTGLGTNKNELLSELFFYQNYVPSSMMSISWSLAVEEHFYIILIIAVGLAIKFKKLDNKKGFHRFAFIILVYCLVARILTSIQYRNYIFHIHYTPTHLRIDALTFGVILAYNYHFNYEWLSTKVNQYKKRLLVVCLVCLTPLFIFDIQTIFMRTVGFTLTYIGFGSLLLLFVMVNSVALRLEKIITPTVYHIITRIGVYSYAIYLSHIQVLIAFRRIVEDRWGVATSNNTLFIWYFCFSLLIGVLLTYLIENPFLKLREKLFSTKKATKANVIFPKVQPV